jgi:hypothetical protein
VPDGGGGPGKVRQMVKLCPRKRWSASTKVWAIARRARRTMQMPLDMWTIGTADRLSAHINPAQP